MKTLLTKEDVAQGIEELEKRGKKATVYALHALLEKGSMTTLLRLKKEIEAEKAPAPRNSPEALEAFQTVWTLAYETGTKGAQSIIQEQKEDLTSMTEENERLEAEVIATEKQIAEVESARVKVLEDLKTAQDNLVEAKVHTTSVLQELSSARASHAAELATLQEKLDEANRKLHEAELETTKLKTQLEDAKSGGK